MQSIRLHIVRPFEDVYAGAFFFWRVYYDKKLSLRFLKGRDFALVLVVRLYYSVLLPV